jgi:glucose-6-phosphate 1-dehydrogenase
MFMSTSTSIVIFGVSGDLAQRKLIPALVNLFQKGRIKGDFRIVGIAGRPWTDEDLREAARKSLAAYSWYKIDPQKWDLFAARLFYLSGDFRNEESYRRLSGRLAELEKGAANRIYYLATPPDYFADITEYLGKTKQVDETNGWRRVVIEKPFGTNYSSAKTLNEKIHRVLREDQIYRIDHYLGKETVQNILVARFANTIFEPVWNRNYIDNVQITVAETVGLEQRAKYYDMVGVVRDMFQNHLLQLMSLIAMEPAASYKPNDLRDEKVKVLKSIRRISMEDATSEAVMGQYRGYTKEEGVAIGSRTPTYAAIRFFIDNWRWQGVPFYLRSGKKMAEKVSEIVIQFKSPPHLMFPLPDDYEFTSNRLTLCLQPDEGIHLKFETKVPDTVAETKSVDLQYHYRDVFGDDAIPEAYERLLIDAINGDASLFTRGDRSELAWEIIDPIIQAWEDSDRSHLAIYEQGSWGPFEADAMLASDSSKWQLGCRDH